MLNLSKFKLTQRQTNIFLKLPFDKQYAIILHSVLINVNIYIVSTRSAIIDHSQLLEYKQNLMKKAVNVQLMNSPGFNNIIMHIRSCE